MKIQHFALLSGGLIGCAGLASASYVNACLLEVSILQDAATAIFYVQDDQSPGDYEVNKLNLSFKVLRARPNGRADGACDSLVGQRMTVVIDGAPRVAYQKGDAVTINRMHKDSQDGVNRVSYHIVSEPKNELFQY